MCPNCASDHKSLCAGTNPQRCLTVSPSTDFGRTWQLCDSYTSPDWSQHISVPSKIDLCHGFRYSEWNSHKVKDTSGIVGTTGGSKGSLIKNSIKIRKFLYWFPLLTPALFLGYLMSPAVFISSSRVPRSSSLNGGRSSPTARYPFSNLIPGVCTTQHYDLLFCSIFSRELLHQWTRSPHAFQR